MKTPDHAAKVWFQDDRFYVELIDGGISHTVHCNAKDCLDLIRSRTKSSKIGTSGAKTQWQIDHGIVDAWLAQYQPATRKNKNFTKEERRDAKELLRRCGLING